MFKNVYTSRKKQEKKLGLSKKEISEYNNIKQSALKRNNKLENLEWCTQSENNKHALDNKLRKHGGDCSFSKLSNEQFKEIYKLATEGKIKQSKIAELYGVSEGNVSKIKLGKVASRITGKVYKPVGRGNGRI